MEIINKPGLKISLSENLKLEILFEPENAPYEPPGFVAYEVKGSGMDDYQNRGIFHLDSKLRLQNAIYQEIEIDGEKFIISLFGDEENQFLRQIQVSYMGEKSLGYDELNKRLFKVAMQMVNNLSLFHQHPITLGPFLIIHNDLSAYTFMDKKQLITDFRGIPVGEFMKDEFFQHSSDNYRKFLNSSDPITRYLSLYISIDSIRAFIRKKLGIYPPEKGKIKHPKYTEPILTETFTLNGATDRVRVRTGVTFYKLLYNDKEKKGSLRNLRNTAAHTVTEEGHFRLTDNLDDYLDYQSALPYLDHMYMTYLNLAVGLYNS